MVPYSFYKDKFKGGFISKEEWPGYERRAAAQLARYKRIYTVTAPDDAAENMAVCEMADALHGFDLVANGEGGPVSSASIGSVSISYGTAVSGAVDLSAKGQAKELYRCACLYLDIYRGVG